MDKRLHTATDRKMKCDRTLTGYHMFHQNTQYVGTDKGKRQQVANDMRCVCGRSPLNLDYVKVHWKSGMEHETDLREEPAGEQQEWRLE